jgi:hypothetical protein
MIKTTALPRIRIAVRIPTVDLRMTVAHRPTAVLRPIAAAPIPKGLEITGRETPRFDY